MITMKKSVFLKALCLALLISLVQIPPISATPQDRAKVVMAASPHAAGRQSEFLLAQNEGNSKTSSKDSVLRTREEDNFMAEEDIIYMDGYFLNRRGELLTNRWIDFKGQSYKTDKKGRPLKNQFVTSRSKVYLTGSKGQILHGIYSYKGTLYYLDQKTGEVRNDGDWVRFGNYYYYVQKDGAVLHDQFITTNNRTYYVGSDGTRRYGDMVIAGKVFHLDPLTGVYQSYDTNVDQAKASSNVPLSPEELEDKEDNKGKDNQQDQKDNLTDNKNNANYSSDYRMYRSDDRVFFMDRSGNPCVNQFCSKGNDIYLVGSQGEALKGVYRFWGKLFLLDVKTGVLHHENDLVFSKGKVYFPQSNGILLHNQFKTIGKNTYYFGNDGSMQFGKLTLNGHNFYMDPSTGVLKSYQLANGQSSHKKPSHTQPDSSKQPMKNHDPSVVIDISYYQRPENIDYDALANDISSAIIRVGYTGYSDGRTTYEDTAFKRHYRELKKRGVPLGAYWYSGATNYSSGVNEARKALQIIGNRSFDLPIYWDTEDEYHQRPASRQAVTDAARGFLTTIQQSGYKAGIYGSANWLETQIDMNQLSGYETWVAHYGVSKPRYRGPYKMWQFTNNYRVDGINVPVDGSKRY